MKLFKKLFEKKTKDVTLMFQVPTFDPKEDITAYEVSQHLLCHKTFIFRGSVRKLNEQIESWWKHLPDGLHRHYTTKEITMNIHQDLLTDE